MERLSLLGSTTTRYWLRQAGIVAARSAEPISTGEPSHAPRFVPLDADTDGAIVGATPKTPTPHEHAPARTTGPTAKPCSTRQRRNEVPLERPRIPVAPNAATSSPAGSGSSAERPAAVIVASNACTPRRTPSASGRRWSGGARLDAPHERQRRREASPPIDDRTRLRPRPPDDPCAVDAEGGGRTSPVRSRSRVQACRAR